MRSEREAGLERISAYYADLQAKCPHARGFWHDGQSMCLNCHAFDVAAPTAEETQE